MHAGPIHNGNDDAQWKTEHKAWFEARSMRWPPAPSGSSPSLVYTGRLLPREIRALTHLDCVFPPQKGAADLIQFVDANLSLGKLIEGH
eukprot:6439801-Pyramimonas_sp.AAC.1